jgi:hypothetical protein
VSGKPQGRSKAASKPRSRASKISGVKKRQPIRGSSVNKPKGGSLPTKAWKASIALLDDEEKLVGPLTPRERKKIEENIRRLNGLITPHKRTFAVKARHPIACACLAYFRQYGRPANLAVLLEWLDQQGLRSSVNADGRSYVVSETTLRRIIRETFGSLD